MIEGSLEHSKLLNAVISLFRQITFEKENDPTVLRSACAGKLLTYEAEDGDMLMPGQLYASMESMKVVLDMRTKKVSCAFYICFKWSLY